MLLLLFRPVTINDHLEGGTEEAIIHVLDMGLYVLIVEMNLKVSMAGKDFQPAVDDFTVIL